MLFHSGMVIAGLMITGFALWAIHYRKGFLEKLGGILAPVGVLFSILGALLLAVPDFFSSSLKEVVSIFVK